MMVYALSCSKPGPVSTGMGDCVRNLLLVREIYLCLTSHPGQLSLAIPPWVGAMNISQWVVTLYGQGVKASMTRVW